jgi:hypothetical protein
VVLGDDGPVKSTSTSGGTRSLFEQLVRTNENGVPTGIRFDQLAALSLGILASAFGEGFASLISGNFQAFVIGPLDGVASFIGEFFATFSTGVEAIERGVWRPLREFVGLFGPGAWLVALGVVVVIGYLAAKGWSLRG